MKSYLARYLYFAFINLMTLPIIFFGLSALLTEKGTALVVTLLWGILLQLMWANLLLVQLFDKLKKSVKN
jgi:hypothetical protein